MVNEVGERLTLKRREKMKKSWKNTLMTFACIGALFTATEASARGHHHHHHGSKDLHRAAAIVDIVVNGLTGLSILNGNAPVVVQPAPTVVTPAPVYVAPSRSVYRRPAPPRRVRTTPPPRSPRPAHHR